MHLLCVDDNPRQLGLMETYLHEFLAEADILTASGAAEALALLEEDRVDCIVSDYQMPKMNGIELLKAVRSLDPDLPFIILTGNGSETVASEGFSAGASEYFVKDTGPEHYEILANRVKTLVEKAESDQEREVQRQALHAANEGIAILNSAGQFEFVNTAYRELLGYDEGELLGEHWSLLYVDANSVYDEVIPAAQSTGKWAGTSRWQQKDGAEIFVDHTLSCMDDGLMVCTARDVTPAKSTESVLKSELNFIETALNGLPDMFFVLNTVGDIVWRNTVAAEITEHDTPEEITSTALAELFVAEDQQRVTEALETLYQTGQTSVEARITRLSGEDCPFEFRAHELTTDDGITVGYAGIGRDISQRKEREQQLEEFAGIVSHDLRNPLSVAQGRLEIILDTTTENTDQLEMISDELNRIEAIIDDLLWLTRSNEDLRNVSQVDLSAAATEAWSHIDQHDATLELSDSMQLTADYDQLLRVFENLFRNAIEHGGSDVTICVGIFNDGFFIEDTGLGIPAEVQENVIEHGFSTSQDGTGMGLSIVHQIVSAHDWDLIITEGRSGGARFEIAGVTGDPSGEAN